MFTKYLPFMQYFVKVLGIVSVLISGVDVDE